MSDPASKPQHQPRIGDVAPDFSCRSTKGEVRLSDHRGRWLVFFSHPADFTPVCTSEFVAFAKAAETFDAIGCDLLGLSVDSLFSHLAWVRAIEERFALKVPFPVGEDPSMAIAKAFGMLDAAAGTSATVRGLFIIDPQGIVRMSSFYPMSTGRSVAEILRTVRALQLSDSHDVATPEGWQPGEEIIDFADMVREDGLGVSDWLYRTRKLEASE
ncbi:peroxiredoxin [Aurantimonas sp. VKM B-3413]|uniref:peroxiredoxin n=1 Tax=Aurantimonas sp. VKM B-3413 TaxID=2779401 RepID=UPI001E2846E5|nr:peroxiredoxin [Aurantimonas sp. VKM B-3413]MCB8839915.1 peroxiredoxin [Aurantimonas sp. VKM B-3413]